MKEDLSGKSFGEWYVLYFDKKATAGHILYKVVCENQHRRSLRRSDLLFNPPSCKPCLNAIRKEITGPLKKSDYLSFDDYTKKALVTETIPSQSTEIDFPKIWMLLRMSTAVGGMLDQFKRKLFYNKDIDTKKMSLMFKQLQTLTFDKGNDPTDLYIPTQAVTTSLRALHGVVGVLTEANELAERLLVSLLKSYEGVPAEFTDEDRTNFNEEIGDVYWYLALLQDSLGLSQQNIMKGNIAKLEARYKGKFTQSAAVERDVANEMIALTGAASNA